MWQSLFMAVNDLNGVSKKGPNWTKLTKIGTYLNTKSKLGLIWKKLNENWDQKGILTKKENSTNTCSQYHNLNSSEYYHQVILTVCHSLITNHYTFHAHQRFLEKSFPLLSIDLLATTPPARQIFGWSSLAKFMLKTYKGTQPLYPDLTKSSR